MVEQINFGVNRYRYSLVNLSDIKLIIAENFMCLAIPGKLIAIYENTGLKMGQVDYDGAISNVCLEYVPEIEIGQYTIVHAGFALSVLDEEEARKTLDLWQELLEKADQARDNEKRRPRRDDEPLP